MQDTFIEAALKQTTIDLENIQKGIHGFEGGGYNFRDTYSTPCHNLKRAWANLAMPGTSDISEAEIPSLKLLFEDLGTKSKAIHNELIIKKPTIRIDDENTSNWSATRDSLTEMNMFAVRLVDAIAKKSRPEGRPHQGLC
ncbi:hypothetical protein V497_02336 [Pseudogymnoascus sp. VKM F-4516 (FW-969)]|nr:hypothetical protein V497_02336 [Pseudogymnoascus sp. VKM F-4516 (FW-969)]